MRSELSQGRSATGFGRVVVGLFRADGPSRRSKVVFFGGTQVVRGLGEISGAGAVCRAQDSLDKLRRPGIASRLVVVFVGGFPWSFVGSSVACINRPDPHSIRSSYLGSIPRGSHDNPYVPEPDAHRFDSIASPIVRTILDHVDSSRNESPSLDGVAKEPSFSTRSSS